MKQTLSRVALAASAICMLASASQANATIWRLEGVVSSIQDTSQPQPFGPVGSAFVLDYDIDESLITTDEGSFENVSQRVRFNGGAWIESSGYLINMDSLKALNVIPDSTQSGGIDFLSLNIHYTGAPSQTGAELLQTISSQIGVHPLSQHDSLRINFGEGSSDGFRVWVRPTSLTAVPEAGTVSLSLAGLAIAGIAVRRRGKR